jgi:hypothetical protein
MATWLRHNPKNYYYYLSYIQAGMHPVLIIHAGSLFLCNVLTAAAETVVHASRSTDHHANMHAPLHQHTAI